MDKNDLKFHVFSDERFVDLNLYQFGYEKCEPLHSYGPYARNHYLFHYVISGKGYLRADGEYQITAGHGFLIEPNQVTTYFADENDPWEYAWIEFDGLRVRESLQLAGISANQPIYTPVSVKEGALLLNEIMYIVDNGTSRPMCDHWSCVYFSGSTHSFLCNKNAAYRKTTARFLYERSAVVY